MISRGQDCRSEVEKTPEYRCDEWQAALEPSAPAGTRPLRYSAVAAVVLVHRGHLPPPR
jgi:hypothetical protein